MQQAAINSVGMGGRDDGYLMPGLGEAERYQYIQNIATGETSQALTPFHSFDSFNFYH